MHWKTSMNLLALGLVLFAGCGGWLRRSSGEIEALLLAETPLTTPEKEVREQVLKLGRQITEGGELAPNVSNYPVPSSEGARYFRTYIGSYGVLFPVDVIAFYIFDQEGRLARVSVRKDRDAP